MAVHEKIRKLREAKDLTQEFMAHELGVSLKTYGRWESGETPLKVKDLLKIAELLDMPVEDIMSPNPVVVNIEKQEVQSVTDEGMVQQSGTITNTWNNTGDDKDINERLARLEAAVEKLLKQLKK